MNGRSVRVLTNMRGIGKSKAKTLLHDFGSLDDIKKASRDELTATEGIGPAVAERLEKLSETAPNKESLTNTRSIEKTSRDQPSTADSDPEMQELTASLKNTTSLEELVTLTSEARDELLDDSEVAVRNPELVTTLAEIYQREENKHTKENYDRVYVLRFSSRALSQSIKHRPEPVFEIIETPLRLLRDTTISKSIRGTAHGIMNKLVSNHPEQLVPLVEEHHSLVSKAIQFRSPDQPDQNAAKSAAKLISLYTEHRDTELFSQHVEALFNIIEQESAYLCLQRIAEEHPTSVLDNALPFVDEIQRHRPDAKSEFEATRAIDILEIASQSVSIVSGQWMSDLDLREAVSPTMRRKLVSIYVNIAENTKQSPINSREKLESLVTDDDWQTRQKAIKLVRYTDVSSSERKQLLNSLEDDPIPEVSDSASEALTR